MFTVCESCLRDRFFNHNCCYLLNMFYIVTLGKLGNGCKATRIFRLMGVLKPRSDVGLNFVYNIQSYAKCNSCLAMNDSQTVYFVAFVSTSFCLCNKRIVVLVNWIML